MEGKVDLVSPGTRMDERRQLQPERRGRSSADTKQKEEEEEGIWLRKADSGERRPTDFSGELNTRRKRAILRVSLGFCGLCITGFLW